jgi:hypothetical protein
MPAPEEVLAQHSDVYIDELKQEGARAGQNSQSPSVG